MPPIQNSVPLETLLIRTPLGLRFWDHGANRAFTGRIQVTAWPREGPAVPTTAVPNPSGIYAFHGLPGLRDWEYPRDDDAADASPPLSRQYVIRTLDPLKRFLDTAAIVDAPLPGEKRLYTSPIGSPDEGRKGFRLFSAPTRPVESHLAVVRAYLWDKTNNRKAAHAVLKIDIEGAAWTGIADENGMTGVMFPYPLVMRALDVTPPSSRIPFHEQSWKLTVRALYGGTDVSPLPNTKLPNLANILNQHQADIYKTVADSTDVFEATLTLGKELVLRTDNTDKQDRSKLFIKPMNAIP